MSTKTQLREAIKREARIKSGANLNTLVDDIVADIMRDYCNLARYYELLKEEVAIVLVAHQQSYSLPADFHHIAMLKYGRGPIPHPYRVIEPQPESVRQTSRSGYPRFYRLVSQSKISFWPYYEIAVADELLLDYYVDPASLYLLDADPFPVPRLESAVKKDAIARIQRFSAATAEAQLTDADSRGSFNAADGGAM